MYAKTIGPMSAMFKAMPKLPSTNEYTRPKYLRNLTYRSSELEFSINISVCSVIIYLQNQFIFWSTVHACHCTHPLCVVYIIF